MTGLLLSITCRYSRMFINISRRSVLYDKHTAAVLRSRSFDQTFRHTIVSFFTDEMWVSWIDRLAEDNYLVVDDFLPERLYDNLKQFFQARLRDEEFTRAGIGSAFNKQLATTIRGDYTYWIDKQRDVALADFFSLLEEMIAKLNRYCYLSLSGYEFHFAHYPKGSFYKRHLDRFKDNNNRMISVIIYLNEHWQEGDGGELKVYTGDEQEVSIAPLARRCVFLRSDQMEHEVLETSVSRFSLTGWLLYQPSSVGYFLS